MAKSAKKKAVKKAAKRAAVKRTAAVPASRKRAGAEFSVKTGMEITAMFPDSMGLTAKVAAAVAGERDE